MRASVDWSMGMRIVPSGWGGTGGCLQLATPVLWSTAGCVGVAVRFRGLLHPGTLVDLPLFVRGTPQKKATTRLMTHSPTLGYRDRPSYPAAEVGRMVGLAPGECAVGCRDTATSTVVPCVHLPPVVQRSAKDRTPPFWT